MDELGWTVDTGCVPLRQLAVAISTLEAVGADTSLETLATHGQAVLPLAEREVDQISAASAEAAVRYRVVGTVFYEPVLLALRRLAEQDASTRLIRRRIRYLSCLGGEIADIGRHGRAALGGWEACGRSACSAG